ncbi:MAG: phage baseplate assembly protein V, partial [Prevotella melaninogenica]
RMPLAETQMATVLSNADPEGKGRVRVRMNWQTDGMQTSWVRVMTPDGGSSSDVKSNRGFVFIPEIGDQVLLGFRHGDPARPYVLGSLFNGTTGGGGGQGNKCKSLTTRSGSSLKLDDSKGSVTLADPGKTSIHMDGAGNATFDSSDKIIISCGSASIELHNDGTIKINGKEISVGGTDVSIAGTSSIVAGVGEGETPSTGIGMSTTELNISSSKTYIDGSSETSVSSSGGTTSVTASSEVIVGGSKVKLN